MKENNLEIIGSGNDRMLYYSNDLNDLICTLPLADAKIVLAACYVFQQKFWNFFQETPFDMLTEIPKATISYKDLKKLSNYKGKNNARFEEELDKMTDRLQLIRCKWELPSSTETVKDYRKVDIFPVIDTLGTEKQIVMYGNIAFLKRLFRLERFTAIELHEVTSLKSRYSFICYCQLRRWRSTGCWIIGYEEFLRIISASEKYRATNVNQKVFDKIEKELSPYFENLKIEKPKEENKRGRPIKTVIFTFEPEKKDEASFTCPDCGQPLFEKVINGKTCWCHKDGWKEGAACSRIFNTVAEIKGYSEMPSEEDARQYISDELSGMFNMEE